MSNTQQIADLKRQAKELKIATGIMYCQALEAIARRDGYRTWNALLAGKPQVKAGVAQHA